MKLSAESGADGTYLSFTPPELLVASAPVSVGCHSLGASAPASFASTTTASDMTPKLCLTTCLGSSGVGPRMAYLQGGDTCHCAPGIVEEAFPTNEDDCRVRTAKVWNSNTFLVIVRFPPINSGRLLGRP